MAKTIWNDLDRKELLARIGALKADQRPAWGKMTPAQAAKHCTLAIQAAMGDIRVAPKSTPFRYWPLQKLIIYALPWPKSAPTAPEFIVSGEIGFEEHIDGLRAAIEKLASRGAAQPLQPHAAFGALSGKDWGALTHRHLDHHLKQFGV
ncbi:MAG: DUF1569 domain-containing protein [Acidobacteria bacterium]|nr:DUF1569 domain-containing protein [Acidobacteriota bacterium]